MDVKATLFEMASKSSLKFITSDRLYLLLKYRKE
jgi:hypothetical protein